MTNLDESMDALAKLGIRLRAARLSKNDSMQVFAERLGVSVSTVREMERGAPTVQVGTWMNAFAVLDSIESLDGLLQERASLIEMALARERSHRRVRASPRRRAQ